MKDYYLLDEQREGMVKLLVPRREGKLQEVSSRPTKADPVFFNPIARLSRDFSILFLHTLAERLGKELSVCELLTGTGVRGIRYIREAPVSSILLNDKNPHAAQLARKNLELNCVSQNAVVANEDAFSLIQTKIGTEWFDFVDIDPFGSPQRYYLAGLLVDREGAIALTATDIPTLIGIYPETALRRYRLTHSFRSEFEKEIAIRTLLASFQLEMLTYGRIFVPAFSIFLNHYIRVFLYRSRSNRDIRGNIGFVGYCQICDKRWSFPLGSKYYESIAEHPHPVRLAGPIWLGRLYCPQTTIGMNIFFQSIQWKHRELKKLFEIIVAEANDFPPWFFDLHKQAQRRRGSPSPIREVLSKLQEKGYLAERTHMCFTGIKTNAPGSEIEL